MKRLAFALALACATIGAAPPPLRLASIVCRETPLYVWSKTETTPHRSGPAGLLRLGETFHIVSGKRETLGGDGFYELDIPVIETGFGNDEHYWVWSDCVSVS